MQYRNDLCLGCHRATSGDCGKHGPPLALQDAPDLLAVLREAQGEIARMRKAVDLGNQLAWNLEKICDVGDKHFKTYATAPSRMLILKYRAMVAALSPPAKETPHAH